MKIAKNCSLAMNCCQEQFLATFIMPNNFLFKYRVILKCLRKPLHQNWTGVLFSHFLFNLAVGCVIWDRKCIFHIGIYRYIWYIQNLWGSLLPLKNTPFRHYGAHLVFSYHMKMNRVPYRKKEGCQLMSADANEYVSSYFLWVLGCHMAVYYHKWSFGSKIVIFYLCRPLIESLWGLY